MDKKTKYILRALLGVVFCYVVYFIADVMIYTHSMSNTRWKEYAYFFKDSIFQDVDTFAYSYVMKRDIYNVFNYKPNSVGKNIYDRTICLPGDTMYSFVIWEFKDLSNVKLNDIEINSDVDLSQLVIKDGEVLESKSELPVSIHSGFEFHNMNVNLDEKSILIRKIKGANYKGFYGILNRLSLSNENGDHEIFFDFLPKRPSVLLLYKSRKSFFVILINSTIPFDENIIKVLNLR